jgi:hypothetical protein
MTSHCGRWRAASSAAAWSIAAVREKFPDATTPTERSRAAAARVAFPEIRSFAWTFAAA